MKQLLKVAALALCAVGLMSSCCKKTANEPTPTPVPTPIDNTKGIKLILTSGQTDFSITTLDGDKLTIEGLTTSSQELTAFSATKKDFKATVPGSTITIKGNVKSLVLSAGQFEKLDLSAAPTTFERLSVNGAKVKTFDFTNAHSLKSLTLNTPGMSGTHNLSHTSLQSAYFRGTGANFTLPQSIKSIILEKPAGDGNGITNDLTLAALPNLQHFYVFGDLLGKDMDFSGSTKLVNIEVIRSRLPSVNLSNCTALKTAGFADPNGVKNINLSGCTALVEGAWSKFTKNSGFFIKQNEGAKIETLNLSGTALTKFEYTAICEAPGLKILDLSNTKLTSANFSKLTSLKELNLLNNPTLTGAELTNALQSLPATQGKIKIANLSETDAAIVVAKGWTIAK